jgi:hypothetical protein
MTLEEAKSVIENDSATFKDWVHATGVLAASQDSTLDDLIACLKRRGLPAEMAATSLYARTKRPRSDSIESVVLDAADWTAYVKQMRDSHT